MLLTGVLESSSRTTSRWLAGAVFFTLPVTLTVVPGLAHWGFRPVNVTVAGTPLAAAAAGADAVVSMTVSAASAAKANMAVRALAARRAIFHQPVASPPRNPSRAGTPAAACRECYCGAPSTRGH